MTFEFKATVAQNGQITLPADVAGQIPAGRELHVLLTWEAAPLELNTYHVLGKKLQEASSYASVPAEETVYDSLA